jgi:hypothetical protein
LNPLEVALSDEVKRVLGEVRRAPSVEREQPLALLIGMALDADSQTEAISGLLELCERKQLDPIDLQPHAQTLIGLCRDGLNEAKPLQGDPRKREWIVDPDYSPIRYRTGLLLDLIAYLPGEASVSTLRGAFAITDPRLKLIAALSLLRNLETVDAAELEKIAASHEVRIDLWEQLREMQMEFLMPEQWTTPDQLAASELSRWIAHPMELGICPEEIELIQTFPAKVDHRTLDVYLFRFANSPNRGNLMAAGWPGLPDRTKTANSFALRGVPSKAGTPELPRSTSESWMAPFQEAAASRLV